MTFRLKFPLFVAFSAVITAITFGVISYVNLSGSLLDEAEEQLQTLRTIRHTALVSYLKQTEQTLAVLASSSAVKNTLFETEAAWEGIDLPPDRKTEVLQRLYNAVTPTGDLKTLKTLKIDGLQNYARTHFRLNDWFQLVREQLGYFDISLMTLDGDLIYSADKGREFATNVMDGAWKDEGIGRAFRRVLDAVDDPADDQDRAIFIDFSPYGPLEGRPAAFLAMPVLDSGDPVGVMAIQMPTARINKILQVTDGMGETGETYLVGNDQLMRSDSRFSDPSTILKSAVNTQAVARALEGETGIGITINYRGYEALSSYQPLDFLGTRWALIAEMDRKEIEQSIVDLRRDMTAIGLAVTLALALGGYFLSSVTIRPLAQISEAFATFGQTHQAADIPHTDRQDEIGEMARTFDQVSHEVGAYIKERQRAEANLSKAHGIISGSIDYASRIQRSILPPASFLDEDLSEHFVIWEPRDRVGGDLYWYRRLPDGFLIALADCTGHGIPGAFLTMIATGAMDRASREEPDGDPGRMLSIINKSVQKSLRQHRTDGESDDGLDMGICRIHRGTRRLSFAGAKFDLFVASADTIESIKGDRCGIGYRNIPLDQTFDTIDVGSTEGCAFYLSTDGLTDQIGGERRRMFGKKRFKTLLRSIAGNPMPDQKQAILEALKHYQGREPRRDDISIIGFKV
ncbi:SpoIIE family protein phosphatase [Magnetospira sp. QH-2]|uniref:SpoIIE family protein phosphatase n=1 Tax=Magnetospira sp. (strain QH-2) TaxID=1288970 RepID=UPI0003E813BF|nr:SpoIIE family protein phosphatase [Magnetospira sp. QH-2]CCQ73601.1 Exported protein of unknown function [Magnetospira sp. QH-2]